jgi:hypothetical protein
MVLLDACRSAGLIGSPSNSLPAADALKSVMNASNVTVLTSSTADRVSREDENGGMVRSPKHCSMQCPPPTTSIPIMTA